MAQAKSFTITKKYDGKSPREQLTTEYFNEVSLEQVLTPEELEYCKVLNKPNQSEFEKTIDQLLQKILGQHYIYKQLNGFDITITFKNPSNPKVLFYPNLKTVLDENCIITLSSNDNEPYPEDNEENWELEVKEIQKSLQEIGDSMGQGEAVRKHISELDWGA